jgi:hypothetical protein
LILSVAVGLPDQTAAFGPRGHRFNAVKAMRTIPDPTISVLLEENLKVLLVGAHFPDSCSAPLNENAHDHWNDQFRTAFLAQLRSAEMTVAERRKAMAFLLGVIAHNEADDRFDLNDGLLDVVVNDGGPDPAPPSWNPLICALLHFQVDGAVDVHLHDEAADPYVDHVYLDQLGGSGYWEAGVTGAATVRAIAGAAGSLGIEVTPTQVGSQIDGFLGFAGGLWGSETLLGSFCPWITENWLTWRPGGVEESAAWVSSQWQLFVAREGPATSLDVSPSRPDGADGSHLQPVTVSIDASGGFGGGLLTRCSLDKDFFVPVNGPIEVSTHGEHILSCYSIDGLGFSGEVQTITLNLDLTPEAAKESGGCSSGAGGAGVGSILALLAIAAPLRRRRA